LTAACSCALSQLAVHIAARRDGPVLGTLEREVAEMEAVRQRLPREFNALMA